MRVYKCDRCGKYFGWFDTYVIKIRKPLSSEYTSWSYKKQICEECKNALDKWFDDPKAKEENDAVR